MSRKKHKPRSDRIYTFLICGWSQEVHKPNPGTPMSILARKRGVTCSVPWMEYCGLRNQVHIPAGLDARPQGQTWQSCLKKNFPNFWDSTPGPPNSPDLNPCYYYL
ncbi:Transposable element tcb1 transposase [Caligus rogercresseyi]|uniref:Transposable element tcb1 transposase n=1 Tax=Caligus rogercresseyi TaxID=217165 RepID=A0A7T8HL49_CALRO|nr:Transposable element tcb1 transposase [Caligus rogercresseyi]